MIPRFKPYLGKEEILASLFPPRDCVDTFEREFAKTFESPYAIAFPYGRSALWAFFNALGLRNSEIIIPAYTCSVVAHAIVLSGNIPRFVDITLSDYNMDLGLLEDAISERTRAVVPTHLFGYPLDVDRMSKIVQNAESRYGQKIWVIQDCAHSFGARWNGRLVCNEGDAAIFGLNISKMITSIFGGMLTTHDLQLAGRLRAWRDRHFRKSRPAKSLCRRIYLLAAYVAFHEQLYGLVNWLEKETRILDPLSKAYHLDEKIHFPPGFDEHLTAVEASVGLIQLNKYANIIRRRKKAASFYNEHLRKTSKWVLPPIVEGATYSHYVIRVPDRRQILSLLLRKGIQLGQLIEYSLPHMKAYLQHAPARENYPNSLRCSQEIINVPIYPQLNMKRSVRLLNAIKKGYDQLQST